MITARIEFQISLAEFATLINHCVPHTLWFRYIQVHHHAIGTRLETHKA